MLRERQVRDSLNRSSSHLPASARDRIVEQMKADGLVGDGAIRAADVGATPHIKTLNAAAADPMNVTLVKQVIGMARHAGVELDPSKQIDSYALSDQLRARGASVEQRIAIKTALAQIGCLA